MLNNLKAISLGVISILILGLINQLLLIMATVGYNSLIALSPAFIAWAQVFTYTLGGLGFFIVMTSGGFLTAIASHKHACSNAMIAALTGSSISLYLSLREDILTPFALSFLTLGVGFAVFGCWLWMKHQQKNRINSKSQN